MLRMFRKRLRTRSSQSDKTKNREKYLLEVFSEHEIGPEELEAVFEGVHLDLRGEHGGHQGIAHPRIDDLVPHHVLLDGPVGEGHVRKALVE